MMPTQPIIELLENLKVGQRVSYHRGHFIDDFSPKTKEEKAEAKKLQRFLTSSEKPKRGMPAKPVFELTQIRHGDCDYEYQAKRIRSTPQKKNFGSWSSADGMII